jgi:autotransporter-associated beta strand protein
MTIARATVLAAYLCGASAGRAQVTNVWTNTVNGSWTNAANWSNGAPVSATNTVVRFDATGTNSYRATNATTGFQLNRIVLNSSSSRTNFVVGSSIILSRNGANLPQILQEGSGAFVISNSFGAVTNITFAGSGTGQVNVAGVISSNVNLIKSGDYVLVLTNNSFGGTGRSVTINGGVLSVAADAGLGSTLNTVTISSNAVLRFTGNNISHNRTITLGTGGGRIEITGTNVVTQNLGFAANTNAFTLLGTGRLILTAASTRNAPTYIDGGTLQINNTNALGTNNANTFVQVNTGGTFLFNATGSNRYSIALNGGTLAGTFSGVGGIRTFEGPISITGSNRLRLDDVLFPQTNLNMLMFSPLSGNGILNVTAGPAAAQLTLTNEVNTFSGTLMVGDNVMVIASHTNGTPLASASLVLAGGSTVSLRYSTTNNGNTNIIFDNTNHLTLTGNAIVDVRRPANFGISNTIIFRTLTINTSQWTTTGANNYQIKVSSNATLSGEATFNITSANVSLDGAVGDGTNAGTLRKRGVGTLFLTNLVENTYSGGTVVEAGTLQALGGLNTNTGAIITNVLGTGPITMAGGTLQLRADSDLIFGPGAGHDVYWVSNSTINADRFTPTAPTGRTLSLGNNYLGTNVLGMTAANTFGLRFNGATYIGTNAVISNAANLSLDGGIFETNGAGYALTKIGAGTLFLTNFNTNTHTGPTRVNQGTLRVHINATNSPNALGPITTLFLNGGTLDVRADNNIAFGPGVSGYSLAVNSNATINLDRYTGALTDRFITNNNLNVANNATLTFTSGNNWNLKIAGTTTLDGNAGFNIGGTRSINFAAVELAGPIVDGALPGTLFKRGAQVLGYSGTNSPTFTGGTVITAGSVAWVFLGLPGGDYQFGSGPISIDGGSSSSFAFRNSLSTNYNLLNEIFINGSLASGGIANYGGGALDFSRTNANNPTTTVLGPVHLRGDLTIIGGTAGSATPVTLASTISLEGADRTLFINSSGNTGTSSNRVLVSGNIISDGTPRNLTVVANNSSGVEFGGNNSGLGSMIIKPSYQGAIGRVRFLGTNALPSGPVTVDSGAFAGLGFSPAVFGPSLSALSTKFRFLPESILGLDFMTNTYVLDLGPGGLNQDVRLGVSAGFTSTNSVPITPFGNIYKIGGGGGTLVLNGANQLSGSAALSVFPNPYVNAIATAPAGGVTLAGSNSFSGGTIVNPGGTLTLNTSNALGTGRIDVYGTLQLGGGAGSLLKNGTAGQANANELVLHPGGTLLLNYNNATLNFNRFGNTNSLTLNGATLRLDGRQAAGVATTETMGELSYDGGSAVNLQGFSTASLALTASGLTRQGSGTLQLLRTTTLNMELGSGNRFFLSNAPTLVNGMVAPHIVNGTDHSFVTYDNSVGFTNVTYTTSDLNAATATDIVNVASATALSANRTVHALRTTGPIQSGGGTQVTIGSGGFIAAASITNTAVLNFHNGITPIEALFYVASGTTTTASNSILANGVTKFGDGTLSLNLDQPAYASGWNLNRGAITVSGASTNGTALGASSASNTVNLNGAVTLNFTSGTNNLTYTSGKIINRGSNSITASFGGGNNADRTQTIAPLGIDMNSVANGPLGSLLRLGLTQNRTVLRVGGPVTLNDHAYFNIQNNSIVTGGSNRVVFAGTVVGTNNITKYGNGILALAANNSATFSGDIFVNAGTLAVGHNGALGSASAQATIRSNTVLEILAAVTNFQPTAALVQESGSAERWQGELNRFANLTGAETFTLASNVNLQLATSLINLSNKVIRLTGGTIEAFNYVDDSRATNINIGPGVGLELLADSKIGASGVDIGRGGVVLSNFAIISGPGSLTKIGLDSVVLATNNTYLGDTTVEAGILRLGVDNALPTATRLSISPVGTLDLVGRFQTVRALNGAGLITNSGGTNPATLTVNTTTADAYNGTIAGLTRLQKSGSGSLLLSGASTFTGGAQVFGGQLLVGADTVNGAGPLGAPGIPALVNASGSLLTAGPYTVPQNILIGASAGTKILGGSTAHTSTFSGAITMISPVTLTAASNGLARFTGLIDQSDPLDPQSVTKTGAGTVVLIASNAYGGGTTVEAGTLLVNNTTGSGTGAGDVNVLNNAILGGTGRIGGSVFLNDNARIRPGASAGALRIDGALNSFASQAAITFEIGGLIATNEYDVLDVGSYVDLVGVRLELATINGYYPLATNSFTLMRYSTYYSTFDNASNGQRINTTDNLGSFRVTYNATNLVVDQWQFNDTDGDGIFDAWAMRYFGTSPMPNNASATGRWGDFDGDGQSNYGEFIAGTIPTDPASVFEVTTTELSGTANFAVRFRTATETTFRTPVYRIQYSSDLVSWTTVTSPVLSFPAPGLAEWVDNGSQTGGTPPLLLSGPRYYRVQVQ